MNTLHGHFASNNNPKKTVSTQRFELKENNNKRRLNRNQNGF